MARTDDRFIPDHGDTITRTASREHDFATPEEIDLDELNIADDFGADQGRTAVRDSLDAPKHQLDETPWVESATVMRRLPDHLRISIKERTPMAFAQVGSKVWLIDANGVLMELPLHQQTK